jgi:hypothetical protein
MEALATTSTNLRARLQSGVNPLEEVDLSGPVAEFIKRNGVYSSS